MIQSANSKIWEIKYASKRVTATFKVQCSNFNLNLSGFENPTGLPTFQTSN